MTTSAQPSATSKDHLPTPSLIELGAALAPVLVVFFVLQTFWEDNPSYQFAYLVPLISVYLMFERSHLWLHLLPKNEGRLPFTQSLAFWIPLAVIFLVTVLFGRLLAEAALIWRPSQYALLVPLVAGLLVWAYALAGRNSFRLFVFPILFLLLMLPWPGPLEQRVIQGLMRFNAFVVAELLNLTGSPAVATGNVIELVDGKLGVNEACSGIRSLQSSIMLAIFFGAFCQMTMTARWQMLFLSIGLAMLGNLCRTFFLGLMGAKAGNEAIETWHDPAGYSVMAFNFIGLAIIARLMPVQSDPILPISSAKPSGTATNDGENAAKSVEASPAASKSVDQPQVDDDLNSAPEEDVATAKASRSGRWPAHFIVALWIGGSALLAEAATQTWYSMYEGRYTDDQAIVHLKLPDDLPTFQGREITDIQREILHFTAAESGAWLDARGRPWSGFVARYDDKLIMTEDWREGWAAHRPEVCFPASGITLEESLGTWRIPLRVLRSSDGRALEELREPDATGQIPEALEFTTYRFRTPSGATGTVLFTAQLAGGGIQQRRTRTGSPWLSWDYYAGFLNLIWEARKRQDAETLLLQVQGNVNQDDVAEILRLLTPAEAAHIKANADKDEGGH